MDKGLRLYALFDSTVETRIARFALEAACWRHTLQLKSNTGGARPGVGSRRVTFDLAAAASFTCSHYLQALVAVMFIDKDIVLRTRWRRAGGHRVVLHGAIPFVSDDTTLGKCRARRTLLNPDQCPLSRRGRESSSQRYCIRMIDLHAVALLTVGRAQGLQMLERAYISQWEILTGEIVESSSCQ